MRKPQDELREAAALIRERATAANTDEARRPYSDARIDPAPETQWGKLVDGYLGGEIGRHCASWTPTVAHAVARWLEDTADNVDPDQVALGADFWPTGLVCAVFVARSFLGDSATRPQPSRSATCTDCGAGFAPVDPDDEFCAACVAEIVRQGRTTTAPQLSGGAS